MTKPVKIPLALTCAFCDGAMVEIEPAETSRGARCLAAPAHVHIHCPRCSPPNFAACVFIRTAGDNNTRLN